MSFLIELTDAVTARLNAQPQPFSQPFQAVRGYLPIADVSAMDALLVTVVPKEDARTLDTRTSTVHDMAIDVGVQGKVARIESALLDPLMGLTQEIADHFVVGRWPDGTTLIKSEWRILYHPEHLLKLHVFTSVVTLTFRAWRVAG